MSWFYKYSMNVIDVVFMEQNTLFNGNQHLGWIQLGLEILNLYDYITNMDYKTPLWMLTTDGLWIWQ